jgi:hypothetical protein
LKLRLKGGRNRVPGAGGRAVGDSLSLPRCQARGARKQQDARFFFMAKLLLVEEEGENAQGVIAQGETKVCKRYCS